MTGIYFPLSINEANKKIMFSNSYSQKQEKETEIDRKATERLK